MSALLVLVSVSRQLYFPSLFMFVCPKARSQSQLVEEIVSYIFVIGFVFCWLGFRTAVSCFAYLIGWLASGLRWFSDSCVGQRFTYAEEEST